MEAVFLGWWEYVAWYAAFGGGVCDEVRCVEGMAGRRIEEGGGVTSGGLEGRRVLVVGASSGIGLAAGRAIAADGARVVFAARRLEVLRAVAEEAGGGCLALACDVRDPASCEEVVAESVAALGGLDALVYAPGVTLYDPIEAMDAEAWRSTLETNVVGATLMTRAAIAPLTESRGKAVFFSSISVDDHPPRYGMAPYVVSKVALETLVRAWQGEHHAVGFTTIAMGDTISGKVAESELEVLLPLVERWTAGGYMYGRMMDAESVAEQVVGVLRSSDTVRRLAITPRYSEEDRVVETALAHRED